MVMMLRGAAAAEELFTVITSRHVDNAFSREPVQISVGGSESR
jgi:hypothetical protein